MVRLINLMDALNEHMRWTLVKEDPADVLQLGECSSCEAFGTIKVLRSPTCTWSLLLGRLWQCSRKRTGLVMSFISMDVQRSLRWLLKKPNEVEDLGS